MSQHSGVFADNITALSATLGVNVPPAPAPDELIASARDNLARRLAELNDKGKAQEAAGKKLTHYFNRASNQAAKDVKDFEKFLNAVPVGYKLVPVYLAPIPGDVDGALGQAARSEYTGTLYPRFHKYWATHAAEELSALGVCKQGIARMKTGKHPLNTAGEPYDVSYDHIVPLVQAGKWATEKALDPDRPEDKTPRYRINHIGNIQQVTGAVHVFKNKFQRLQYKEEGWVLIPVRERTPGKTGLVCPPQEAGHLAVRSHNALDCVTRMVFCAQTATDVMMKLEQDKKIADALKLCRKVARAEKMSPAAYVAHQTKLPPKDRYRLSVVFADQAGNDNAVLQEQVNRNLRPALKNLSAHFDHMMHDLSKDPARPGSITAYKQFKASFNNRSMKTFRKLVKNMPLREAGDMHLKLSEVELKVKDIFAERKRIEAGKRVKEEEKKQKRRDRIARKKQNGP